MDAENRKLNAENLRLSEVIGRLRVESLNAGYPEAKAVYDEKILSLQSKQQENLRRMRR